ncbi:MAG: crotonase/enoyl-CoA hydratase family protein [Acidimicrobiales bacterium]|jgi:enoyl-CoA hydratase/carnithine racemase|nr:crotonase/enoyl-CoA hydratase family protein [Acidimicrobiales bacterium]MDP6902461.1 crotonase/enoyl-CoA hydratase family protein [Acidimicrobiales bacterium]HJL99086.1 crotonase/enoyl-CoA hydratase family protein [Acidimicrobiales bacterium]
MPEFKTLRYEVADHTLTLTMNRPERLNAFNSQMQREFLEALEHADSDDEIRVVIVTGEGRGFCAGADLEKGAETFDYDGQTEEAKTERASNEGRQGGGNAWLRDGGGLLSLRLYEFNKPIIAAINGPAVGVGVTMTLPMDIRLASTAARIGFVFSRRGIVPEACSSYFLPRVVGVSKALEWAYSGKVFDAEEALAGGLVRSIHEPEDLMPAARAIASEIATNTSAISVTMIRHMMWRMLGADHPMEAHKVDSRGIFHLGQGADAHEGVVSFLEKRAPDFTLKTSEDMPEFFPWWDERHFE